jgi:Protein kinase domain
MATQPSSPKEADTIPNSPVDVAKDYDNDFARLTPSNDAARVAFHAVAELIQLDQRRLAHARQFVYVYPKRVQLSPEVRSDTDTSDQGPPPLIYTGYYRLNLDILPRRRLLGWRIGHGRHDQQGDEIVDLQLCVTGGNGVRSLHARIAFDFKTNVLFLIAEKGKKVVVNGVHEIKESQRVLGEQKTAIEIGNLRYTFEYTVQGRDAYQHKLDVVKRSLGLPSMTAPLSVGATPSEHDYEFHDYFLKPAFESGSTCTVLAGVHKTTGALVAVKRMNRSLNRARQIADEIDMLHAIQEFKPNVSNCRKNQLPLADELKSYICRLVDDIVTGDRHGGPIDRRIDEAYLIYTPLAANTFDHLISSGVEMDHRLVFTKQILQGITYLHSIGVMHRDIKPGNLMVVSYEPPRGMITDFGCSTFENTSSDHYKGTLCYLAPEVWDIKHGRTAVATYDEKIDVWAYGVCLYQVLCWRTWWWGNEITAEVSKAFDLELNRVDKDMPAIAALLRLMLCRDPRERISAEDALRTTAMRITMLPEIEQSALEAGANRGKRKLGTV